MEIPAELDITQRLAARAAAEQTAPGELGRDAFMQLLITQLENQDPLSPLQDHEFISQLATFSSLEELEGLNQGMQASLLMDQSVNNALATNLIGKEVLADGTRLRLGEDGSSALQIDLAGAANVIVLIRDSSGELVKRIDMGSLATGRHDVSWDGTNEAGQTAPAGDYSVEVMATNEQGLVVGSETRVRALVTGVRFDNGAGFLVLGDQSVPLSSVLEVFAPSGG